VKIEQAISINAPPAKVWDVMADVENWPRWTESVTKIERLDSGPFAVGSRAKIKQPRLPEVIWEVIDLEPSSYFAWRASSRGVTTVGGHRVAASDGGSTVTLTIDQGGPMSWLASLLFGGMSRRYVDMEAQGLKRYCESS
jgi:uncharacterized membrane protein